MNKKNFNLAFTMAEILLSLTIIGVVAAITLPSLTGNINERTWNTQKKALYARMSQAIPLMGSINGYGIGEANAQTQSNAAKIFITEGLAKVYKINNICDSEHFQDCGISSTFKNTKGSTVSFPKTNYDLYSKLSGNRSVSHSTLGSDSYSLIDIRAAAFETANGESIAVFYQPFCINSKSGKYLFVAPYMCANFVFDLNGKKGPNTAGKDIGYITAFYPIDSTIVMPLELPTDSATGQNHDNAQSVCTGVSPDVRIPSKEELAAMLINYKFNSMSLTNSGGTAGVFYAAKTESVSWTMDMSPGLWSTGGYAGALRVRCIKR